MARAGTHFTEYEDATLIRMKGEGASVYAIAAALGRSRGVIDARVHLLRLRGALEPGRHNGAPEPSPEQRREAERAYAAPRSTTAAFCGDPPLGRSALDRRSG